MSVCTGMGCEWNHSERCVCVFCCIESLLSHTKLCVCMCVCVMV